MISCNVNGLTVQSDQFYQSNKATMRKACEQPLSNDNDKSKSNMLEGRTYREISLKLVVVFQPLNERGEVIPVRLAECFSAAPLFVIKGSCILMSCCP